MNEQKRYKVFISHVSDEAALGKALKALVEDIFPGQNVHAFLSSDRSDLPAGKKWLNVISDALDGAAIMISVLSPTSLARPWVNIELGAGWIRRLEVIPLLHGGLHIGALPRPFSDFNAVDLAAVDSVQRLIGGLSEGLGFNTPQRLAYDAIWKELQAAAAQSTSADVAPLALAKNAPQLPPEQEAILVALARVANAGHDDIDREELPGLTGIKHAVLRFHLDQLREAKLIHVSHYSVGSGYHYSITPAGSGWLISEGKMPD